MKIKEGFILRKIAGTDIVVPIGNNIANFNGIISLNETAALLWKMLKEGTELSHLAEALITEYDIAKEQAEEDAMQFVNQLRQANILDEC